MEIFFAIIYIIGFLAATVFVVVMLVKIPNKRLMKQMGLLSVKFGDLPVEAKKFLGLYRHPAIFGEYKSRKLHIGSYTKGYGKHARTYTFITVSVRPVGDKKFDIYEEGFFSKLKKKLGFDDIKLNDPHFDDRFVVTANDEQFVKQVLTPDLRQKFYEDIEKKKNYGSVKLEDSKVSYTQSGLITNDEIREHFEDMVDLLYAVSDRVDEVNRF